MYRVASCADQHILAPNVTKSQRWTFSLVTCVNSHVCEICVSWDLFVALTMWFWSGLTCFWYKKLFETWKGKVDRGCAGHHIIVKVLRVSGHSLAVIAFLWMIACRKRKWCHFAKFITVLMTDEKMSCWWFNG